MTNIEMMTWVILSLELSAGLMALVIGLVSWSWFRDRRMSGAVNTLIEQVDKHHRVRSQQITALLGAECPPDVLEHAVQVCLERERALLWAVADSIRSRGNSNAELVPSAVQALTEVAMESGRQSVPIPEPDTSLIEENGSLKNELASTRQELDALDQEYRAAFEKKQTEDAAARVPVAVAAAPVAPPPAPEPEEEIGAPDLDFDELAADLASMETAGEVIRLDEDEVQTNAA